MFYPLPENVTRDDAEAIPENFNNNIRWNLGHIYLDQFLWIEALTKEQSETTTLVNSWFGFGTSPSDFTTDTPTFEPLISLLENQPAILKKIYGQRLRVEFPPIDMGVKTIEQVLIRTIFHEGMHLQAIMDIKKCLK
ncbi:hypothetical protein M948_09590 [Virgibacillus sp. CM-4]|uniref:DinB family protein n=1 Tax=Virgibacillus sp. CM-4 TaxID=1354277 RepID=UPI00038885DA|nr:hypothetical protein M948_09590 [Virgibacillus sp. CM-4]